MGTPLAPTDPQQDVMRSEGGGVRDEVGGPPADGRKLSLCSDLRLPGSPQASDWPLLASGEENLLPERVLCSGVLPALYSVHNGNFQVCAETTAGRRGQVLPRALACPGCWLPWRFGGQ